MYCARRTLLVSASLLAAASGTYALAADSPLDPTSWGVVYDVPGTREVVVQADVPYLRDAQGTLTVDIYLPAGAGQSGVRPAVVFLNAVGDRPDDKVKDWAIYRSWPRLVAAHGLAGVSMDARRDGIQDSLRAVFSFLAEHGAEHGIDGSRLGVYAASANVSGATEYLMGEGAAPGIRAAALYYGQPPERLRGDLPVFYVAPESDARRMVSDLTGLWSRVLETGAPWTLAYASDMPHAFDAFTDTDEARRIVRQTIAFWKAYLDPLPARTEPPSTARAIVAALYGNETQRAAELLADWVEEHPEDAVGWAQQGRVLAELRRFPEATTSYERALALGSTDPGLFVGLGQSRLFERRWEDAAVYLARAIESGARASQVYGQLGLAQLQLGRNAEAVRSYELAFEAGIPPGANTRGVAWYNLACGYSRLGRTGQALEALGHAIDEGFSDRRTLETDADLEPLRPLPGYREIVARLPAPATGS